MLGEAEKNYLSEISSSQASIIFFLNDMVEQGVLGDTLESGRGGYQSICSEDDRSARI